MSQFFLIFIVTVAVIILIQKRYVLPDDAVRDPNPDSIMDNNVLEDTKEGAPTDAREDVPENATNNTIPTRTKEMHTRGNTATDIVPTESPILIDRSGSPIYLRDLERDNISRPHFNHCLDLYVDHVRDVYQNVEHERFDDIPTKLRRRYPCYITRDELITLDKWAQKRGRPLGIKAHKRNEKLIQENTEETVRKVTEEAFKLYHENKNDPFPAIKALGRGLRGVASSRASLLLSVAYPETMMFLSDELHCWMGTVREENKRSTVKTRSKCFGLANEMRLRIGAQAIDVEKVAFVLKCEKDVFNLKRKDITSPPHPRPEPVGRGSYGTTVYAIQPPAGWEQKEFIAVKRIFSMPSMKRHRLFAEINDSAFLAQRSPDHFVKFYGWNEELDFYLLAMEYIKLGSLESHLKHSEHSNPIKWTEMNTKSITKQILEGLEIMHGNRMAHRDLKPQNILVVSKEPRIIVKIADFGISKRLSERGTTFLQTYAGTHAYKAPEVIRRWREEDSSKKKSKASYTEKVDLWSLGCIVFNIAARRDLYPRGCPTSFDDEVEEYLEKNLKEMNLGAAAIKFVRNLLQFEASRRPSARDALNNPWITGAAAGGHNA
ncbi:kinase-like protein [Daldinia caldariorum]|uniref:kinase-like protein n=1 Tax=Daldinia caldariorum TaxID=326644 RepID=UPI0020072EFC|nr:kinase-like protein [Daldinia caldariorum]KAI1470142.1 kinase-like protein [Daldinia caldariorum]